VGMVGVQCCASVPYHTVYYCLSHAEEVDMNTVYWIVGGIGVASLLVFGYMFFRGKAEYERILNMMDSAGIDDKDILF
jgi:multidrug transporter EmrE-like cation transporter